ncbi:tRNA1(Val) (adenine(37)-N6)-methyltransferase [Selenihalanaerobacter shriftii]|uniref:tRNA1(Val) A37 N6-methylase TrmN6 n=1 Tax=Selenihalanaerobacter shriftii TaxID=142842 RepID=A0A1T4N9E8_9FIRM|nr:tRNA1(Val) (adenine(37)-N6)-methyltransferase [Selenihalanaerobacter shriftii]SJZ75811.1 tRNA1(Val) A37 N6-methylase TrmN6 [Selenihalanaerobacter shriftii]
MSKVKLKEDERLDDLIHNGLKIIQSKSHFSFAIDAVLLADFAEPKSKDKVIDLGTGTGVIPLLLMAKYEPRKIIGIELQAELVSMARRSIQYNGLKNSIQVKEVDIKKLKDEFVAESFDLVVSNPPYLPIGQGKVNSNRSIALARHEIEVELNDIVKASAYLVKYRGRVTYIHRAERLDKLLRMMNEYNLQPKELRLIYPYKDRNSNLVLVTGVKGAKPGLKIKKPLVIYKDNGNYTSEVMEIYYGSNYSNKVVD